MKQQDLAKHHNQTVPEIETQVQKMELELVDTKMKQSLGQIKNLHASKSVRQDIARLKTIIRHKQLTQKQSPPKPTSPKAVPVPVKKSKTTKTITAEKSKPTKKTTTKEKTTKK